MIDEAPAGGDGIPPDSRRELVERPDPERKGPIEDALKANQLRIEQILSGRDEDGVAVLQLIQPDGDYAPDPVIPDGRNSTMLHQLYAWREARPGEAEHTPPGQPGESGKVTESVRVPAKGGYFEEIYTGTIGSAGEFVPSGLSVKFVGEKAAETPQP